MSRARDFADLAGSADAGGLTGRNLIINGAMQVAQRGTSVTGLESIDTLSTCDRWRVQYGSSGTFTESQSTTAPSGFSNSIKLDCTTADASPNYLAFQYKIEGQDVQHLQKGSSEAKSVTLSFYVRTNKTGTYQVNLRDIDNDRMIGATYTVSSADTWEYKAITFAGDTSGVLDNNTGASLLIEWWLASGSTYNSGAVPTAWEAKANGDRAAGLTVNIGASTDDDFHLTGVQLEVGEQATPFEHRPYGDELARCQRYFYKTASSDGYIGNRLHNSENRVAFPLTPQTMRTTPTITAFDLNGNSGELTEFSSNTDRGVSVTSPSVDGGGYAQISAGGTNWGNPVRMLFQMDAEL
jgi:hypothetical protein